MPTVGALVYIISPTHMPPKVIPAVVCEVITRVTRDGEKQSLVVEIGGEPRTIPADVIFDDIDAVKAELHRRVYVVIEEILEKLQQSVEALTSKV